MLTYQEILGESLLYWPDACLRLIKCVYVYAIFGIYI